MPTAKKASTKKLATRKAAGKDFDAVFAGLKQILQRHAGSLFVTDDKPGNYYVETVSRSYKGKRLFFAAVQTKKNYASFHLMPVYAFPGLLKGMSPELKRRMQGKSCFNFTAMDAQLFGELARLTDAGFQKFQAEKLL